MSTKVLGPVWDLPLVGAEPAEVEAAAAAEREAQRRDLIELLEALD